MSHTWHRHTRNAGGIKLISLTTKMTIPTAPMKIRMNTVMTTIQIPTKMMRATTERMSSTARSPEI